MLALVPLRINLETQTVVGVPANIADNRSLILFKVSPDHCNILSLNGMAEKLPGQVQLRFIILRHHQQPRSIHVNAMDQHAHALVLRVRSLCDSKVIGKCVYQCSFEMTVTGMHHHAGRLVHDQKVFIFIYYV